MTCTIDEKGLKCTYPESPESIEIFFHPVSEEQRRVVSCSLIPGRYVCTRDEGFGIPEPDATEVLVTVPDELERKGSFVCDVAGFPRVNCQLKKNDLLEGGGTKYVTTDSASDIIMSTEHGKKEPPEAQNHGVKIAVGVVCGVVLICATVAIGIWLYKRYRDRSTKEPPGEQTQGVATKLLEEGKNKVETTDSASDLIMLTGRNHMGSLPRLLEEFSDQGVAADEPITENKLLEIMACALLFDEKRIDNAKQKLTPDQAALLKQNPRTIFLTGSPCTGKTMMLLLKGMEWLESGEDVFVVGFSKAGHAVCSILSKLLLESIQPQLTAEKSDPRVVPLQYDLTDNTGIKKAVNDVSQKAKGKPLHIIAYEADTNLGSLFQDFYDKLLKKVPDAHLWAAKCKSTAPTI